MYFCIYCTRECKSQNALTQHSIRCKLNPMRIVVKASYGMLGKTHRGGNQYTKAASLGLPKPILSDQSRQLISRNSKAQVWSNERRADHSITMKRVVLAKPESYSSANRGRTKCISIDGIKCQGQWEVDFYLWCKDNNIDIRRNVDTFPYTWNGDRTYIPDFYLPTNDIYIEIKGYKTDRDSAKWNQFPKCLLTITKHEIKLIRDGTFTLGL